MTHFLHGEFNDQLNAMEDPREKTDCTYAMSHMAWLGIVLFSCHMGSRNELDRQIRNANFVETLNWLADTCEDTASCGDNLATVMENLDPPQLEEVAAWVTRTLIRSKALDRFRLFDRYFLVVVDGTDAATFEERHCDKCVASEGREGGPFKHKVLLARLVTDCGLTLPVAVEFIENPAGGTYDKQDCERKAFNRIAPKIA